MLKGWIETINPKGGKGAMESIIFLALVLGVLFLNYKGIEVSSTVDYIVKALLTYMVGYMVGTNNKKSTKEGAENE